MATSDEDPELRLLMDSDLVIDGQSRRPELPKTQSLPLSVPLLAQGGGRPQRAFARPTGRGA